MRTTSLAVLALTITACGGSEEETDTTETDTDTQTTIVTDTGETDTMVDGGDTIADALPLTFTTEGDWLHADAIAPAGDRDFFSIEATEGDIYQVASLAYLFTEPDVVLDTVLRVYGPDEQLIATNDDMPYRFLETDSAIFFQATETGTYYVEVLEWGDWDAESTANGGNSYTYELWGYLMETSEVEPNNTAADASDESIQDTDGDGFFDAWQGSAYTDSVTMFYGAMDEEGDQDLWWHEMDEEWGAGYYCQWSFWPQSVTASSPEITLYNEYMEPIAQTMDPSIYPVYNWVYDAGITYNTQAGDYYLGVVDAYDQSGAGTFYPGLFTCYSETLATVEEEDNDSVETASLVTLTESTSTDDYWYSRVSGDLSPGDGGDFIWIRASDIGGTLMGRTLNASVAAEAQGSYLDANITVWGNNGGSEWVELAFESDGEETLDPEVAELELTSDWASIVIEIGADDQSNIEGANSWHMFVGLSPL